MRYLLTIILFLILTHLVSAQASTPNSVSNVLLRNEASFGVVLHSEGAGMLYRRGKHVTGTRKRILEIEGVTMHHPKEIKISRSDNSKGFYFGKLNSLYFARTGAGFHRVLFRKGEGRGAEIRYAFIGGGTLSMAKPVFLDIYGTDQKTVSSERYDPDIHNSTNIYGRSSFFTGIRYTRIYPGFYGKVALSCELGDNKDRLRLLEVGAVADIFPFAIPVMASQNPQNIFANFYISYSFGKKWI